MSVKKVHHKVKPKTAVKKRKSVKAKVSEESGTQYETYVMEALVSSAFGKRMRIPKRHNHLGEVGRCEYDFNEEVLNDIEHLAPHMSIDGICDYLGISRTTWYRHNAKNPDIEVRYRRGLATANLLVAKNKYQSALENPKCAEWWLERRAGGFNSVQNPDLSTPPESSGKITVRYVD